MVDAGEALFPIAAAARRLGLSPHVLRAWERRYGAVQPVRRPTGERLYRASDLERLALLRAAVAQGHRIGQIARWPTEVLRRLAAAGPAGGDPEAVRAACTAALEAWRPEEAAALLARAQHALPWSDFRDRVLLPLLHGVGDAWRRGDLCAAQEHLFSHAVRGLLERWLTELTPPADAPLLLAATPTGQRHEFGAMLAALSAQLQGWRARYLGPDLPPEDVARAARPLRARAVALSAVLDAAEPAHLRAYVLALREDLPREVPLLLGGRGFVGLALPRGARWLPSFDALAAALAERTPAPVP